MARTDLSYEELIDYRPAVAEPADFDTFWNDTIAENACLRPRHAATAGRYALPHSGDLRRILRWIRGRPDQRLALAPATREWS